MIYTILVSLFLRRLEQGAFIPHQICFSHPLLLSLPALSLSRLTLADFLTILALSSWWAAASSVLSGQTESEWQCHTHPPILQTMTCATTTLHSCVRTTLTTKKCCASHMWLTLHGPAGFWSWIAFPGIQLYNEQMLMQIFPFLSSV